MWIRDIYQELAGYGILLEINITYSIFLLAILYSQPLFFTFSVLAKFCFHFKFGWEANIVGGSFFLSYKAVLLEVGKLLYLCPMFTCNYNR